MLDQLSDNFASNMVKVDGLPLLCLLASTRQFDSVERLLSNEDLDVDARDIWGRSALLHAAEVGDRRIAECLLDNGADIDLADRCGKTALIIAAARWKNEGCAEVVRLLLERRAQINRRDSHGMTPLFIAARDDHPELCELLINYGANVKRSDRAGRDALWHATTAGNFRSCATLLRLGGPWYRLYGQRGRNLLSIAASKGHEQIVNLYLRQGLARLKPYKDDAGMTPLHYAAIGGSPKICRVLLGFCMDIDEVNDAGWTPLMYAAKYGNKKCLKALIEYGAKIDHVAVEGKTALAVAMDYNRDDCVKVLLNHTLKLPKGWL